MKNDIKLNDFNKKSLIRLCQNHNAKEISKIFNINMSEVIDVYTKNKIESYLFVKSLKSCKFEKAKETCQSLGYRDALECIKTEGRWFFFKYITTLL